MPEQCHNLAPVTLEYAPRPGDREERLRTARPEISRRNETDEKEGSCNGA